MRVGPSLDPATSLMRTSLPFEGIHPLGPLSLYLSLSLSLTHTRSLSHTHTCALSIALSLSLSQSPSQSLALSLYLALALPLESEDLVDEGEHLPDARLPATRPFHRGEYS